MKKCSKCNNVKPFDDFCFCKKSKDNRQSQCKNCKCQSLIEYYKNNPDKKPKRTKEAGRKRYYDNKINMNFSRRIRQSLKGDKNGLSWEILVDYTLSELKIHLEKQFKDGMTWNNYGEWHIDHIKPISLFKIDNMNDNSFKECWSLKNLQPLWEKDNLSKSNKYKLH